MSPSIVTPGNYDGVHLGHRALLARARELARAEDLRVTSMIFDPHPAHVLGKGEGPSLLTTVERRRSLLSRAGADHVEVVTFDTAFAAQAPEDFVRNWLASRLSARGVVVGPDFRFGKGRGGDLDMLRRMGETLGFVVDVVAPVVVEGDIVSSTRIRATLDDGRVEEAARLLARIHDVDGTVIRGHQRGRTLGFPTANLRVDRAVQLPKDGVYAVVMKTSYGVLRGVANLGVRPTLEAGRSLEAHLFDFDHDLYDQEVRLGFVARLRDERRFDGLDALKAQIDRDAIDAVRALDASDQEAWSWM